MRAISDLSQRQRLYLLGIFVFASVLWLIDAKDDLAHGSSWDHLLVEGLFISVAAIGASIIAMSYFNSRRENLRIQVDLDGVRKDLESYKRETAHFAKGLSLKIDFQLNKWGLSTAEKEIALLLLKGFSNREISELRGTSEKTVTQQITSIYLKSGLRSRPEFSAFFLEDLLAPTTPL